MAYSEKVIDHYENPRNVGSFDKGDDSVGTGMVGAPACGDVMKLQIKVNPVTGVIEDARFKTYGCGSAIASSSLVTDKRAFCPSRRRTSGAGTVPLMPIAWLCRPSIVIIWCAIRSEMSLPDTVGNGLTFRSSGLGGDEAPASGWRAAKR